MQITKFRLDRDLGRLEAYLRERYREDGEATSWLPERLHDLLYRVRAHELDEGREPSTDHIYLWEANGEILACILPDGENVYVSIKHGYEQLFPSLVTFSEEKCRVLFPAAEDGTVKFWFAISDSMPYAKEVLAASGYREYPEKEYMNCAFPAKAETAIALPQGFQLLYGEEYPNVENKWSALRMGFHPELESQDYRASMSPYQERKKSSLYPDSFECLVVEQNSPEKNNVCSYCFVYVDKAAKTALIEPVSTRERYQHKGLGTAMMHGVLQRCQTRGIERCYVDSFGWRKISIPPPASSRKAASHSGIKHYPKFFSGTMLRRITSAEHFWQVGVFAPLPGIASIVTTFTHSIISFAVLRCSRSAGHLFPSLLSRRKDSVSGSQRKTG